MQKAGSGRNYLLPKKTALGLITFDIFKNKLDLPGFLVVLENSAEYSPP